MENQVQKYSLGSILEIILITGFWIIVGWWIFNIAFSDKTENTPKSTECPHGYHWDGYTTAYGEVVDGCFKD